MEPDVKPRAVDIARLARDIAMDILGTDKVLEMHQVSQEDWQRIQASNAFKTTLADMAQAWNDAGNTKQRVKVAAATAVESLIEPIVSEILNEDIPFAQRIEGFKVLVKLGGMAEDERIGGAGTERFVLQIVMGETKPAVTIDAQPVRELTTTAS